MESNLEVLNKVRKDIEEKLNEQFSSILRANHNPDELMNNLDLKKLEEDICEKYNEPVESIEVKFSSETEELWASLNASDFDDYDKISQNLNNNKSTSTQLKTLDKLLSAYIIDTKQKSWMVLSRNLQQCLLSANDEVFKRSLRIHYKIISTPTASSEGYLNLIQALILMFNSDIFKNSQVINESIRYHRRTINILKLVLRTQKFLLKNWLHTKQKIIEEVLITFIYMLNYSMGNEHELGALDFLSMLDSEAQWFRKFCYGLQTRNIILSCLKKTPNIIKYFINTFLNYLDDSLEDSKNHRQFVNFSHSAYFLSEFLTHRQAVAVFPIKVKMFQEAITYEYFVFNAITKINDWDASSRKTIVVRFLQRLFVNNCNLILNSEIQKKLFEPFNLKGIDKKKLYSTVEKNIHVLHIMNDISKSHCGKFVLYNLTDFKKLEKKNKRIGSTNDLFSHKEKNNSVIQIIVNVTIACVRHFVNKSESQHYVNNVIFELINCCKSLFNSSPRTFSFVNTNKLIIALRDFYKTLLNHNFNNVDYKLQIASCLCFFIESDSSALKILESETEFLHDIITTVLMNGSKPHGSENKLLCSKLILSIAEHKEGTNIITNNHDVLIKELLMRIWSAENDEKGFMLSVNTDVELNSDKLLYFLHLISYNFKAIKALLSFENEGTVVENQEKSLVLAEVIENCLDPAYSEGTDTVLGLKVIKVLITNADVLLHLQKSYMLQESLIELQVNSRMPCSEDSNDAHDISTVGTAIVIDECSSLRHNILLSIKYTGKIDAILNEKLVDQSQIIVAPYQSSSALRRYSKASSELHKFLHESKNGLHDHSWSVQARRAFKASCKEKYKTSVIIDLVDQIPKIATQNNFTWPSSSSAVLGLFAEEQYGISLVTKFGIQIGVLQSSAQNEENLTLLLKQTRTFLNVEYEEFVGFDWFTSIVFLICSGNIEKCKSFISNVVNIPVAPLIWTMFATTLNSKENVCDQFYQQLEIILEDTSRVNCALQSLGTSPRHIVKKWLSHCFFYNFRL
ncbi:hypothetical protein ILUMI_00533 [Ignelater luminosus]|uniref:Uncharacterized protein n=1 Tax=Ignelater luminosus TaxID=2038154 RepID=A0A8K0DM41_IGNLU|nr:hypothetical protein ILUMI_00533 [Ignelater luminosus]